MTETMHEPRPVPDTTGERTRFGLPVTPGDLAELADRLDAVTQAEHAALDDIMKNPHVIGEGNE